MVNLAWRCYPAGLRRSSMRPSRTRASNAGCGAHGRPAQHGLITDDEFACLKYDLLDQP